MPPFPANDALYSHYTGFIALLSSCKRLELLVWEGQCVLSSQGNCTGWDLPGVLPMLQPDGGMTGHERSACTWRRRGSSETTGVARA